jgi:hypothetical protein
VRREPRDLVLGNNLSSLSDVVEAAPLPLPCSRSSSEAPSEHDKHDSDEESSVLFSPFQRPPPPQPGARAHVLCASLALRRRIVAEAESVSPGASLALLIHYFLPNAPAALHTRCCVKPSLGP